MLSSVNTIWVLVAAALVFFMQAGFAMVETGLTRAKNTGNILMKNMMDFSIGTVLFWLFGFGIMFAGSSALIGGFDFLSRGSYADILPAGVSKYAFMIFQTVFCATAATIVSGAMAERTKFLSYCVYSAVISGLVYPVSGHWIWGGGWLAQLGFHDFAGSTAVHMVGGISALIGAIILGPRIGKYDKNGKSRAIPGHSLPLAALGVFILWFCWFGFNGGSTVSAEGGALESMGKIFVTTNIAAAVASLAVLILTWILYKKPDVSMTFNGALAGLVGITAGCDAVTPSGAAAIGLICGILVFVGIEFLDKVVKVDDPVGAVGVHGICGATGTLLVGLFATDGGLLYGGGFKLLGVQALGVISVAGWVVVTMTVFFLIIKKTIGLRASREEEIIGLDISEHGLESGYGDFSIIDRSGLDLASDLNGRVAITPEGVAAAIPATPEPAVTVRPAGVSQSETKSKRVKITKIEIITKQNKFEALKRAMDNIGITGMTVTQVLGYGAQGGRTEYYRGIKMETTLLPKIKVEIVVSKVPVDLVVEEAKKVLYTGNIGDGKIFVYDTENVIKVRTGEEGYDALQDVE